MPGPITYAAITLLARDRIGQIKRALQARKAAGTAKELELHVLHLATQAELMMNASQPVIEPPVRLYGPPLTEQVSRFTLLGAVGPDLPRYAAYFVPGQRWLFDTLHKGTPDEHRELVLTNSTNLVFDFVKRVSPMTDAEFSGQTGKQLEARLQMRAYALGHLCHIAADVLSHPYFESIEARLSAPAAGTVPAVRFMRRDDVAGAFDVRVASTFFGRGTDTRDKKWADWFPTPGDVPKAFSRAMAASIESIYGARALGLPAFDEEFGKLNPAPPPLSAALIGESVDYFRTIIEVERVWTYPDWLGATAAMFLPMSFAYLGALALPFGKDLSRELTAADPKDAADRRLYESVVFPLAFSSLGPLVTMIIVSATGRQLRAEGVTGWVHAGLSVVSTVGFFASLGGAGAARWTLWFALPLAFGLFQTIFAAVRGNKENARKLLWLGPVVQIILSLFFLLLYKAWLHEGVEELQKDSKARNDGKAFGYFAAWFAIVLALWFLNAVFFRWVFSSSVPDDQDLFSSGEPRQFLRLYDDVGLVHNLGKPLDSERLGDLAYPPARRAIVKFWWEPVGGQTALVVIAHDRITFSFPGSAVASRLVFAPLAPITIERWATLLASAVTADGVIGKLQVKPVRDDEKGFELPAGALFADNGDSETSLAKHDVAAIAPANIGASETTAFTLFHTPRPRLAEQMGRTGVAPDAMRTPQATVKAGLLLQAVAGTPRQFHATNAGDGSPPLLRKLFRPGDVLEITTVPPQQRIVEQVLNADPTAVGPRLNETDVVLSSAFPAGAVPAAGIGYRRAAINRSLRLRGTSPVRNAPPAIGNGPNDIQAVVPGTSFGAQFMIGDIVELATPVPARRKVVAIQDVAAPARSLLTLDAPAPVFAGGVFIDRLSDAESDGFPFVADASDVFGDGESVMNDSADLAALLCLGAASRLANTDELATPDGAKKSVHRVYQVFRNWNLDRRRVNEWKLIVSGGADSERRGDFRATEDAAPVDAADAGETFSDAFVAQRQSADAIVREQGWLGVFRGWVDMASRARTDTTSVEVFRPGAPSNRDLSRAMAYLLDSREGVAP